MKTENLRLSKNKDMKFQLSVNINIIIDKPNIICSRIIYAITIYVTLFLSKIDKSKLIILAILQFNLRKFPFF